MTLSNRPYVLFQNGSNVTCVANKGHVLFAGEKGSGKTLAMLGSALNLVRDTPHPAKGKRHLLWFYCLGGSADAYWLTLYSWLLFGVPGKQTVNPRTAESNLKTWLKGYGFDIVVTSDANAAPVQENYEVIHVFQDEIQTGLLPAFRVRNPGVRFWLTNKKRHEQAFSYECSYAKVFSADLIIETSIPTSDSGERKLIGTMVRCKRAETGKQFTIANLSNPA